MKEFISKYQKAIVGTGAVAVLIVCYLQQKELARLRTQTQSANVYVKQIDSLTTITDSLTDELFMERIDAGRHEITREEIFFKHPKVGKEYDEFYSHNTE